MKRSNVDLFLKNALEDYPVVPRDSTWEKLSDELHSLENKKKKNSFRVSMIMFLMFLICSIQFTGNKVTNSTNETFKKSVNQEIGEVDSSEQDERLFVKKIPFTNKKDIETRNVKLEKKGNISDNIKEGSSLDLFYVSNFADDAEEEAKITVLPSMEFTNLTVESVTEEDLELLLKMARTDLERERALAEMSKTNAHSVLAEIKRESEQPAKHPLYNDVKQGFIKLKTVLAN